jgi:DNA-binding CsgD family transcriptional regulator
MLGGVLTDTLRLVALPYHTDDLAERRQLATAADASRERAHEMGNTYPTRWSFTPLQLLEGGWDEARASALNVYRSPDYASKANAGAILVRIALAQGDGTLLSRVVGERLQDGPETQPGTIYCDLTLQRTVAEQMIETGNLPVARTWLEAHDRWLAWSGAVLGLSEGQTLWAQYLRQAGDATQAHEHAERALRHATTPRQPLALLAAHRLLGELAIESGQDDDASQHLLQALTLADACAAPYEHALTLLARAELHLAQRDVDQARVTISEVQAICEPLGAGPALARAAAFADRLDITAKRPPAYPAGLSEREVEVLRLLAAGKTNREIADILFLSEHTVRVHVRNILTKTETENRTAAAAFALQHGFVPQ